MLERLVQREMRGGSESVLGLKVTVRAQQAEIEELNAALKVGSDT